MQEFSDTELIENYLRGNTEALEQLISRYFKQVFLFSKTFVKQNQEAEDITQEVFVKVWKNIKKFKPEKKFKTWLFQITKNTCIDFLRKNKNFLAADALAEEQMSSSLEKLVDESPLPQELFDSADFEKKLEEVLNAMPSNYKVIAVLHLQQGLTFQEIAELLKKPLNTVKSGYRRALLKIRENLPKSQAP